MTDERKALARGLLGNSMAILAMTLITALLGYVFWMFSARQFTPAAIGVANTTITAMTLVAVIAVGGFIPILTRMVPQSSPTERSGLLSTAIVITVIVTGVVGAVSALVLPRQIKDDVGLGWLVVFVALGGTVTALLLVINAALVGARRAELSLAGNVVGSVLRLGALGIVIMAAAAPALSKASATHALLTIWILSLLVSFAVSLRLFADITPKFRFHPSRSWFARLGHPAILDHIATVANRAPLFVLSVLAAIFVSADQLGYLAMAVLVSSAFGAVAASVSSALLADCSGDLVRLHQQASRAVRIIAILLVGPVVITTVFAAPILGFFGPAYARNSSAVLVVLLIATFPDAIVNLSVAVLRLQERFVAVVVTNTTMATICTAAACILMPRMGILGAGWGWLICQTLTAGLVIILLIRGRRNSSPKPTSASKSGDIGFERTVPGAAFELQSPVNLNEERHWTE